MRSELEEKLVQAFPQIFRDIHGDSRVTCMTRGIETDDGWFDLIFQLCSDIMAQNPGESFKANQIKEKWAGLTFSTSGCCSKKNRIVSEIIKEAIDKSTTICEKCGSIDDVQVRGQSWLRTLCNKCCTELTKE